MGLSEYKFCDAAAADDIVLMMMMMMMTMTMTMTMTIVYDRQVSSQF